MKNPTRRSRNIGKTQGGRVKNGAPSEKWSRVFSDDVWRQLSEDESGARRIFQENPSKDFFHPSAPAEIEAVLARLPSAVTDPVKAVILRRTPHRDVEFGVEARRAYACVILNAYPRDRVLRLETKPEDALVRHMAPWCASAWTKKRHEWCLAWAKDELKNYYLYHLLLHEVGHLNQPDFHAQRRREEFAENFALEWARRLGALEP